MLDVMKQYTVNFLSCDDDILLMKKLFYSYKYWRVKSQVFVTYYQMIKQKLCAVREERKINTASVENINN